MAESPHSINDGGDFEAATKLPVHNANLERLARSGGSHVYFDAAGYRQCGLLSA